MEAILKYFNLFAQAAIVLVVALVTFSYTKNVMLTVAATVAALLAVYFLFKDKKDEIATLESEIEQAKVPPSYNQSFFNQQANLLEQAFFDLGTDEDTVFRVFKKLKNDTDVLSLFAAWGERTYTGGWFPGVEWILGETYTLEEVIYFEMSTSDRTKLNWILSGNKIKYRFS